MAGILMLQSQTSMSMSDFRSVQGCGNQLCLHRYVQLVAEHVMTKGIREQVRTFFSRLFWYDVRKRSFRWRLQIDLL